MKPLIVEPWPLASNFILVVVQEVLDETVAIVVAFPMIFFLDFVRISRKCFFSDRTVELKEYPFGLLHWNIFQKFHKDLLLDDLTKVSRLSSIQRF